LDRLLAKIETPLNLIGGLFVLALAALGIVQVFMRSLFDMPIIGYVDFIEQGTAVFAFLGLAYCQREGEHIRMEILLQQLSPANLYRVEVFNTLFATVVVGALLPGAYLYFERAFLFGDSTMSIGLPTWPSKLLVFCALVVLLARLLVQLAGFIRLTLDTAAEPVAVPLPHNVAELAAQEVELAAGDRS
jgi:TRAP-type C4-dicarboxylate transport system permease small subunit